MRYLWLLALLGACKTEHMNTPDAPGPPVDPWWQPKIGEAKNWDVQLTEPIDISAERVMYDLDLWAVVPTATTINYDDGTSVPVPAGAHPDLIAQLHTRENKTVVICHVNTGSIDLLDPDAKKFPGWEANPPDDPTAPKTDSAVGWSNGTLRFLDIRTTAVAAWEKLMWKRFDLAKQIGCDGIEPDKIERGEDNSGWTTEAPDLYAFYGDVAEQVHMRKLSVGMKGGNTVGGTVDMMAPNYDWMMVERCGEFNECDTTRPFINLQKDVFAIDYDHDVFDADQDSTVVCARQQQGMVSDGIYKDIALTSKVRVQCNP